MPTYELIFLMKQMSDSALRALLSRTAMYVLESGANLRKIENLGIRQTPEIVSRRTKVAQYYLYEFDAGVEMSNEIRDKFRRDVEIIKATNFVLHNTPGGPIAPKKEFECNVYEDDLPPPYRPNILKLMETAKKAKKGKKKFDYGPEKTSCPI